MAYNDEEKIKIAWQEYSDYEMGDRVRINSSDGPDQTIGYISDIFGEESEVSKA